MEQAKIFFFVLGNPFFYLLVEEENKSVHTHKSWKSGLYKSIVTYT